MKKQRPWGRSLISIEQLQLCHTMLPHFTQSWELHCQSDCSRQEPYNRWPAILQFTQPSEWVLPKTRLFSIPHSHLLYNISAVKKKPCRKVQVCRVKLLTVYKTQSKILTQMVCSLQPSRHAPRSDGKGNRKSFTNLCRGIATLVYSSEFPLQRISSGNLYGFQYE